MVFIQENWFAARQVCRERLVEEAEERSWGGLGSIVAKSLIQIMQYGSNWILKFNFNFKILKADDNSSNTSFLVKTLP